MEMMEQGQVGMSTWSRCAVNPAELLLPWNNPAGITHGMEQAREGLGQQKCPGLSGGKLAELR